MSDVLDIVLHLKALRIAKGLTQEQLARKMGYATSTIVYLERRKGKQPLLSTVLAYAHAVDADLRLVKLVKR